MEAVATKPASSTAQLIEELCDNFASWAPALACPPAPGEWLAGGHNHYLRILESPTHRWVARIARNELRSLGERQLEASVQTAAAEASIAPPIHFSDPRRGITIMDYLEPEADCSDSVEAIAELCRQVHALPLQGKVMHAPDVFRNCHAKAVDHEGLEALLKQGTARIATAMECLEHNGNLEPSMCHNDLLGANRLYSRGRLFALDWEYAAPGDPFFDLAVCASQLTDRDARALLGAYLQRRPRNTEKQRFAAQCLLYACIEACWYSAHQPHASEMEASLKRLANHLHRESLL